MDMDNRANLKRMILAILALSFICAAFVGVSVYVSNRRDNSTITYTPRPSQGQTTPTATPLPVLPSVTESNVPATETPQIQEPVTFAPIDTNTNGETLSVHFINVGEADSIFVTVGGINMLIDAGESNDGKTVVQYLQNLGVETIHYLIATHPDQDHIGGMDSVIGRIKTEKIYINNFYKESKHYENLMESITKNNLEVINPKANTSDYIFSVGAAKCQIIAPLREYVKSDSNNSSIVIRMTFGEKIFLFMGDAEKEAEADILSKYPNLEADVVKIAHHGRSDSTSAAFVERVKPKYAVIPCEEQNITSSVIKRLENAGTETYVLGRDGNKVFTTDGKNIEIQ